VPVVGITVMLRKELGSSGGGGGVPVGTSDSGAGRAPTVAAYHADGFDVEEASGTGD
jgi:hypothetical protein